MNYTNYFAQMIKQSGMPNFDYRQLSRMFKIISIENQIKAFEIIKRDFETAENARLLGHKVFMKKLLLEDETRKLTPNRLWTEMVKLSDADLEIGAWNRH